MTQFVIDVRYRTNSGCNAKTVVVEAEDIDKAFQLASEKVRRQRGVVKIDGGDWRGLRFSFEDSPRYRADMIDAGRGRLLR